MSTSTSLDTPAVPTAAWGTARLLAGVASGPVDLARHRVLHGARRSLGLADLADACDAVRLLGRGGAAFPVAAKLGGTAPGARTHVVVNGSEGEPASHKDRALFTLAPHLVLDGALAVAAALRTRRVTVVVQDPRAHAAMTTALDERDDTANVTLLHHDHGFVGGEVRAVLRAVSGGPALPPGRRAIPTEHGVDGRPTFASNVETFAQIAVLLSLGTAEFGSVGSAEEPGTTLLTLLGGTRVTGVVEVPTGMPLAALVGPEPGPVLVGGYHGTWIDDPADLVVSRPALRAAGAPHNAGVIARPPRDTCLLGEVISVARWLADESAGQCGPCVFGLPALVRSLELLACGRRAEEEARHRIELLRGRGACAHPDGAAGFVVSALDVLGPELALHREHGHCGRTLRHALPVAPAGFAR